MKVSIVTVCLNAAATIEDCVASVAAQRDADIEHIIIDGGSHDATLSVIEPYRSRIARVVSEKDNGLYDAMNKGLALATGDVIGFLNADDTLARPDTIARLTEAMQQTRAALAFGDVEIYGPDGNLMRIYRANKFRPERISSGVLPPHPSVYAETELVRKAGGFDTRFRIAADFDLLIRIFQRFSPATVYVPDTIVHMRSGGTSSRGLSSYLTISRELIEACDRNKVRPNRLAIHGRIFRKGLEVVAGSSQRRYRPLEAKRTKFWEHP